MNDLRLNGIIHVDNLNLWAHVGVLDKERLHGQKFLLDFQVEIDLHSVIQTDNVQETIDYGDVICALQKVAYQANCKTIEAFSDLILDCLESFYGRQPMKILLRKCCPPVPGFNGTVGIKRKRN